MTVMSCVEPVTTPYDQWGKRTYLRVCRKLKIAPITSVLRDLTTDRIDLMHRGLTEGQIIAVTTSLLVQNTNYWVFLSYNSGLLLHEHISSI